MALAARSPNVFAPPEPMASETLNPPNSSSSSSQRSWCHLKMFHYYCFSYHVCKCTVCYSLCWDYIIFVAMVTRCSQLIFLKFRIAFSQFNSYHKNINLLQNKEKIFLCKTMTSFKVAQYSFKKNGKFTI
jgi:hypothetical protein